ncbi:MAG: hypothetical protein P1S60_03375 [Anaerolineae bacterium]|nr:hypothetical protein [Anaerolineae bacterium]
MEQKHLPPNELEHWVAYLKAHHLAGMAAVMIRSAEVWGYLGGQILWMLTPFLGETELTHLAELLENPSALHELRDALVR